MKAHEAPRRQRLTPEARRRQILDETAKLVIEHGLSAVSMEAVGRICGVSKALIYNYFPSRDQLLAALLQREQNELRDRGMRSALEAKSFGDLIRQTTRLYLEQTKERGALVQALLSDPSVARLMEEENRVERDRTIRFFVREGRREYNLTLPMAIAVVDMLMAVTDRAGRQTAAGTLDIDTAEDMCVALITGGLERLSQELSPKVGG
jgi:AcrR family transcriptional regulator